MIDILVERILLFLPDVNVNQLKIEQTETNENSFEVSDRLKGTTFLYIVINEDNNLESFSVDTDYFNQVNTVEKENVIELSRNIVNEFVIDDCDLLHLSAAIDFDGYWLIEFIRKDSFMGLELPNSGVSIQVDKNGLVSGATIINESFEIEEPVMTITTEDAKQRYLDELILAPLICRFDTDFIGGDDEYYLVYAVEDFVMDIGTDGEIHTIEMFDVQKTEYVELLSVEKSLDKDCLTACKRSILFLQSQYENALENFRLLKKNHQDLEDECFSSFCFTFQRFERGIRVGNATIRIEVDPQTFIISEVNTDSEVLVDLSKITNVCTIPLEDAIEIYGNALEMELCWSKEVEEDQVLYKLNYLSSFPETVGHMRAIDATTGKPWIIDTSYMEEF
jgi:uncharacterized protein YuzE